MKLYLVSQNINNDYNTYDSVVVAAKSRKDARTIHPYEQFVTHVKNNKWMGTYAEHANHNKGGQEYEMDDNNTWVKYSEIDKLKVETIGTTDKPRGVILASFNAG